MTEDHANIYRARNARTNEIVFFVGIYDENTGRYVRRLTAQERKLTGCTAESGSLSYVGCQYNKESSARSAATRQFGYSKIELALYNLGASYERAGAVK